MCIKVKMFYVLVTEHQIRHLLQIPEKDFQDLSV